MLRVSSPTIGQLVVKHNPIWPYLCFLSSFPFAALFVYLYFNITLADYATGENYLLIVIAVCVPIFAFLHLITAIKSSMVVFDIEDNSYTLSRYFVHPKYEKYINLDSYSHRMDLAEVVDVVVQQSYFVDATVNVPSYRIGLILGSGQIVPLSPDYTIGYSTGYQRTLLDVATRIKDFLGLRDEGEESVSSYVFPEEEPHRQPLVRIIRLPYPMSAERPKMDFSRKDSAPSSGYNSDDPDYELGGENDEEASVLHSTNSHQRSDNYQDEDKDLDAGRDYGEEEAERAAYGGFYMDANSNSVGSSASASQDGNSPPDASQDATTSDPNEINISIDNAGTE